MLYHRGVSHIASALFCVQFNFNRYMERRHIEGPNGSVQCTGVTATRALYEATVRREVGQTAFCSVLPASILFASFYCCDLRAVQCHRLAHGGQTPSCFLHPSWYVACCCLAPALCNCCAWPPCPHAAQLWQTPPSVTLPHQIPVSSAQLPPAAQAQVLKTDNLEMLSGVKATDYTFSDGSVTGAGLPVRASYAVRFWILGSVVSLGIFCSLLDSGLVCRHSHVCISADAKHTTSIGLA
jgi:hypothetical protein